MSLIAVLAVALLLATAICGIVAWYAFRSLAKALDEDGKQPSLRYLDDDDDDQ